MTLFTDGACKGNPGPGGWAFILRHNPSARVLQGRGAEARTTNNQMELRAVIEGLKCLKRSVRIHIVTDSKYVKRGLEEWLTKWKHHGWRRKTATGHETLKNVELWRELDGLVQKHELTVEWTRGHHGHPENEHCDRLAVQACRELLQPRR